MAEPKAIVALVPMSRAAFTRYTQSDSLTTFAREIYSLVRDQQQGYIVFTYVADKKCFFYCQWTDHSSDESNVVTALEQIGGYLDKGGAGYIVVHPSAPNFLADSPTRALEVGPQRAVPVDTVPRNVMEDIDALTNRFLYANTETPFEDWLKRKELIDRALQKAYEKVLTEHGRLELAERIKGATPNGPIRLFSLYVFDGTHVSMVGTGRVLEDADPYSLGPVKGGHGDYVADDRFAYYLGVKIPGAHGPSFRCLATYDNIHNLDRDHAYYFDKAIEGADPATFETLDYSYAKDARHFYSGGTRLGPVAEGFDIDVCGFLKTRHFIHHYEFKIPLDPETFEILDLDEHRRRTNPFIGTYLLRDKSGTYVYDSTEKSLAPKSG